VIGPVEKEIDQQHHSRSELQTAQNGSHLRPPDIRREENSFSGAEKQLAVADWSYAFVAACLGQGGAPYDDQSREHGSDPNCRANARRSLLAYGLAARS